MLEFNFSGNTGSECGHCEEREENVKVLDGFNIVFIGCLTCLVKEIKNNRRRKEPSTALIRLEDIVKGLEESLR